MDDEKEPMKLTFEGVGTTYTCPCGSSKTANGSNKSEMQEWMDEHAEHNDGTAVVG